MLAAVLIVLRHALSVAYILFLLRQFYSPQPPLYVLPTHVFATVGLVYLWRPTTIKGGQSTFTRVFDLLAVGCCLYLIGFYLHDALRVETRIEMVDPIFFGEKFAFCVGIPLLLEAVRRTGGNGLLAVVAVFFAYGFLGKYMPGWFRFKGFSFYDYVELTVLGAEGLFGVASNSIVYVVFYFIAFGAVFSATGGGKIFIDLSMFVTGRLTGGSAKTAIVASALFGTISGSAIANVTSTGVFTIPLMKQSGYTPEQAAATEAIASTGGQLMPPIMGVAAFVMADLLGIPYTTIALAGVIPALGYYFAIFLNIDLLARKSGMGNVDYRAIRERMEPIQPRLHLLAGPVLLVAALVHGYSAPMSAMFGTAASLVAPLLRAGTRYGPRRFYHIVLDAARQLAEIAVPVSSVGIVIVVAMQSGLAFKFIGMLAGLGQDNLFASLLLVILGCMILGLGLPTTAAYIIAAIMFVPALTKLDVERMAAHFFVLYYAVLSMVTPPVALAAFAAAGIAKANPYRTGWVALGLGFAVFIMPFGFIRDPALLWQGEAWVVFVATVGILCATSSWAIALQGWLWGNLSWPMRALLVAICCVIVYEPTFSAGWSVSMAVLVLAVAWRFRVGYLGGRAGRKIEKSAV